MTPENEPMDRREWLFNASSQERRKAEAEGGEGEGLTASPTEDAWRPADGDAAGGSDHGGQGAADPDPTDDHEMVYRIRGVRHRLEVWPSRYQVRIADEWVDLTPTEMRVLTLLVDQPGRTWKRAALVRACHGGYTPIADRSVDFIVHRLRQKAGALGAMIQTVRGSGYMFNPNRARVVRTIPCWIGLAWLIGLFGAIRNMRAGRSGVAVGAAQAGGAKWLIGGGCVAGAAAVIAVTMSARQVWWPTPRAELLAVGELPNQTNAPRQAGATPGSVGGFSGISRLRGSEYLVVSDAPREESAADGPAQMHRVNLSYDADAETLRAELLGSVTLRDEAGEALVVAPLRFSSQSQPHRRQVDPEGVAVTHEGRVWVVEGYHQALLEFDLDGRLVHRRKAPEKFHTTLGPREPFRPFHAQSGVLPLRGFSGVSLSPDGRSLFAVTEAPLAQDGGMTGMSLRVAQFEFITGRVREFVYPLNAPDNLITDVLAIDDHTIWVIERDQSTYEGYRFAKVIEADLGSASDVGQVEALPDTYPPNLLVPLRTSEVICLHTAWASRFPGRELPHFQGLTLGPELPDGRRLLFLAADNDHASGAPNCFAAFAVNP